ncbi:hypothetical protein N0V93_007790 [Gnomoniopsis smithogilvyi]|uniref:COP9 signalosome complex subunit 6 n=1 Tax=Gnomoniopsis smithogilvyi TaxID=1191159 RepID=A0A9W8YLZ4_9PEZI|nr:hypothetical protein N0V93_007790 [Gnomoniopsis smithogilvyi]
MEHVILHPLPLIAISDYVVRHTLRKLNGPVVGALLGQQNGREVSIEFAYEVKTETTGDKVMLDSAWFDERLEQMRAVHKDRNLDLVGWFTQLPRDAPRDNVLPIHTQILEQHNESALLLGFHADEVGEESLGGKLPVTIYETNYEVEDPTKAAKDDGEDKEMKDGDGQVKLSFRQVPFVVETGEAEMISMSDVASGATNAASAQIREKQKDADVKGKGKGEKVVKDTEKVDPNTVPLSQEDEDMIAAIQTKANAIKMLKSRIDLIVKYLQKLPPPYMAEVEANASGASDSHTEPSQSLLRLIQALVHRLSLVEPADAEEFKTELLREENDVQVISMLNELMSHVNATRDVGKKFSAIESGKAAQKQYAGFSSGGSQQHGSLPYDRSGAGDLMM